jgi:transcriptional regulator with XRE-family HTH domain
MEHLHGNGETAYDGRTGTAGGAAFGACLAELAAEKDLTAAGLARAADIEAAFVERVLAGNQRVSVAVLAAFARALRTRPIEFMQKSGLLSLQVYAQGLDPLFFLPAGPIRHDARIYMREINPRHAVPEGDMTRRNPLLKLLSEDSLLDPQGKLELELTYLLRTAVGQTGGTL